MVEAEEKKKLTWYSSLRCFARMSVPSSLLLHHLLKSLYSHPLTNQWRHRCLRWQFEKPKRSLCFGKVLNFFKKRLDISEGDASHIGQVLLLPLVFAQTPLPFPSNSVGKRSKSTSMPPKPSNLKGFSASISFSSLLHSAKELSSVSFSNEYRRGITAVQLFTRGLTQTTDFSFVTISSAWTETGTMTEANTLVCLIWRPRNCFMSPNPSPPYLPTMLNLLFLFLDNRTSLSINFSGRNILRT